MTKQKSLSKYIFGRNSETSSLIVKHYYKGVSDIIFNVLETEKGFNESDAVDFIDKFFSASNKQYKNIKKLVEDYITNDKSEQDCADELLKQYYKISSINLDNNKSNREEVIGINENSASVSIRTSPKMFEILITKITNLGLKFIFNTHHIKNESNTLNVKDYMIFMETKSTDSTDIIYQFKYNNFFSNIVDIFNSTKSEISFYIGITNDSILHYGFITDSKKYEIGHIKYTNNNIYNLSKIIYSNSDIDFKKLSNKFKSSTNELYYAMGVIKEHTMNYEDVYTYIDVIDNTFMIIIENEEQDILSEKYIIHILENNIPKRRRYSLNVKRIQKNNKEIYKIYVNK